MVAFPSILPKSLVTPFTRSIGDRLYKIFRNPVDIGVQATDLFVDWARVASDEEWDVANAFVESWRDNVMGQMSASGTGEQNILQEMFGPEGLLGAPIEALPVGVRNALGGGEGGMWDLTMEHLQWTYKNIIDRPLGTIFTVGSLNPLGGKRDPVTGIRTGERGYNTKLFEWDTYQNIWDLTTERSAGQALVLMSGQVDIYDPESLKEFKASPKYFLVSGIFDAGLNVGADPAWIGARGIQWSRAVRHAKSQKIMGNPNPLWPEEVTDYLVQTPDGQWVPGSTHVEPGLMPNRSFIPFNQKIRPGVRREPLILRTPSRQPIRVGGRKLHDLLNANPGRYPRLERLLGGVADTLTIPGGVRKGSQRTTDPALWENWSWNPKWMDETPPTREIIIDDILTKTEQRLQAIVVDETPRLIAQGILPNTRYLSSGELGLRPEFGVLPATRIPAIDQGDGGVNSVPWSLTEDIALPITSEVRDAIESHHAAYRVFNRRAVSRLSNRLATPSENVSLDRNYGLENDGPYSISADYANQFFQLDRLLPTRELEIFTSGSIKRDFEEDDVSRPFDEQAVRTGWDSLVNPARIQAVIDELGMTLYDRDPNFSFGDIVDRDLAALDIQNEIERLKGGVEALDQARDAARERLRALSLEVDGIDLNAEQAIFDDLEAIEQARQNLGQQLVAQFDRGIQLDILAYYNEIVGPTYNEAKTQLDGFRIGHSTSAIPDNAAGVERFYGAELWNLRADSTFSDVIALRIYNDMKTWGNPFKNMVNDERWQLAKVYAHLANAMEPNTVAWLPFRNFQKYVAGDKETILAMRAQLREMQHLWSLLRRIPGPAISPQGDTATQFAYDWEQQLGPMDESSAEWQKEFPAAWGSPQSLHWHFRELGLIRKNISALDMWLDTQKSSPGMAPVFYDLTIDKDLSDMAGVEGIENLKRVERAHVDGIVQILKRKERAHALLIQHYLFNPAALVDVATQAAKAELVRALSELGITDEAWDTGIPPELIEGARETLIEYQTMRSMHADDPDASGIEQFKVMPLAQGHIMDSARDVPDVLGLDRTSPFAELIDRLQEMSNFPWQALLSVDESVWRNLVQDTYAKHPEEHQLMNPELVVRGVGETLPELLQGYASSVAGERIEVAFGERALQRIRTEDMLSPREVHEQAIDSMFETINLELPRTIDGLSMLLRQGRGGVSGKTFHEKSGLKAGFTNSWSYQFFVEKTLEGVIDLSNKHQTYEEIRKFIGELRNIDITAMQTAHQGTGLRLASGESASLLDLVLVGYRSSLPTHLGIPANKWPASIEESNIWADLMQVDLMDSTPAEIGPKLEKITNSAIMGIVEALVPDKKFAGLDWAGADVRANLMGILRDEMKAAKRLLEESGDATGKRYGNVDFTDIIGSGESGQTIFVRKPISPSQVRQAVVLPRIDKWKRLEKALKADWKTIHGPGGIEIQVGLTPTTAAVRNFFKEGVMVWKTIMLLTPRWQLVVNMDSQLRMMSYLDTSAALAGLGASFDTLQVRWLRGAGIDINAATQKALHEKLGGLDRAREIDEELIELGATGSLVRHVENYGSVEAALIEEQQHLRNVNWVGLVDVYNAKYKLGEVDKSIEEFVADVIADEYQRNKLVTRNTLLTGMGLFFGGVPGAAAASALYTAHQRKSLQKYAQVHVAESYGIATRNEAYRMLQEAEELDIFRWLSATWPERYVVETAVGADGWEVSGEDLTILEPAVRDLSMLPPDLMESAAGSTEAKMYAKILLERNILMPEDIALYINTRFMDDVIRNNEEFYYRPDLIPVGAITNAPFFRDLSVANQRVVLSRIDELDHPDPQSPEDSVIDIVDIDPGFLEGRWPREDPFETIGEFLRERPGEVPPLEFITREMAERIYGEDVTLLELAQEHRRVMKERREAADMLANRVQAVTDYQKLVIQDFKIAYPEIANKMETAAEMLAEAGYGSTQIGSTRIDNAFGDVPQAQAMWRRQVSANPTARTQLQGGAQVQRERERYLSSHQYDINSTYERESFVAAYDDFLQHHVQPQTPEGVSAPQDYWRLFLKPLTESLTDREIVSWLHREGRPVLERLGTNWDTVDEIRDMVHSTRYEANSLIPTVFSEFDPVLESIQAGNRVGYDTDIVPALDRLGNEIEMFWDNWLKLIREPGITNPVFNDPAFLAAEQRLIAPSAGRGNHLQYLQTKMFEFSRELVLDTPDGFKPAGRAWGGSDQFYITDQTYPLRRLLAANWIKTIESNPGALVNGQPATVEHFERLVRFTRNRGLVDQIRVAGQHTGRWEELADEYDMPFGSPVADNVRPKVGEQGLSDFGKTVNDSQFISAVETTKIWTRFKDKLAKPLNNLAEAESVLSRSVAFAAIESREVMRRLQPFKLPTKPGEPVKFRVSADTLRILQDKARAQALKETREILYDLAKRTKFEESLWAISPFFGAWQEVITRWFGLAAENPVFVSRGLRAFAIIAAEDENGETVMVAKLPNVFGVEVPEEVDFFGGMRIFGEMSVYSKMPLDVNAGTASMLSGTPGTGFIVQYLVSEVLIRIPELSDALEWLIPYGLSEGDNMFTRLLASAAPAWGKNFANVVGLDSKHRAATAGRVLVDILAEYYERGITVPNTPEGRQDLEEEVERRTRMIYSMRGLRSLVIPVAVMQQSPYHAILKEFWRVQDEHGVEVADEWLLTNHAELWAATARNTLAKGVISATLPGHKAYEHHKEFAQDWPELGSFIVGRTGALDVEHNYNRAVRQIEEQSGRAARLSVRDHFYEATTTAGWRDWKVYRNSLTDALFKRAQAPNGSANINHRNNLDLYQQRRGFIQKLSQKYPAWGQEWNNVADPLTQRRILQGFREVLADSEFEYRPEIPVIRKYIELHDYVAIQLEDRAAIHMNPIYERLSYSKNADLQQMWELGVLNILTFPDFGNIYDHFFANIDTVKVANSPRRPPPSRFRTDQ